MQSVADSVFRPWRVKPVEAHSQNFLWVVGFVVVEGGGGEVSDENGD